MSRTFQTKQEEPKNNSIIDGLKVEDCSGDLSDDQFSERYELLKCNQEKHEQQLSAIKLLVNSSSQQLDTTGLKSKKEILKEKRDKKKLQIISKKEIEEIQLDKNQDKIMEDKLTKQKIKSRESAQLSRDRKKQYDIQIQQDMLILTEENKFLQRAIQQTYTCQSCGYVNNPVNAIQQIKLNQQQQQHQSCQSQQPSILDQFPHNNHTFIPSEITQEEINYNQISPKIDYYSLSKNLSSAPLPVHNTSANQQQPNQPAADYSRTNPAASNNAPFNLSFAKGMWSMALIVFILFSMVTFSDRSDEPVSSSFEKDFRQLIERGGPYDQLMENCRDFSKEELLECILRQLLAQKKPEQDLRNNNTQSVNEKVDDKQTSDRNESDESKLTSDDLLLGQVQGKENHHHHIEINVEDNGSFIPSCNGNIYNEDNDDINSLSSILLQSRYNVPSSDQPLNGKYKLIGDMITEQFNEEQNDALRRKAEKNDISNSQNGKEKGIQSQGEDILQIKVIFEQGKQENIKKTQEHLNENDSAEIEEKQQVKKSDIISPNISQSLNDISSSMNKEHDNQDQNINNNNILPV